MRILHDSRNHQNFYPAHVCSHFPHERLPNCLDYPGQHRRRMGHRNYLRERVSVYPDRQSLEPYLAGYLHQSQGLVYRKRSAEYLDRYRHLGSSGARCLGSACNRDASAIGDCHISAGQFVRFLLPSNIDQASEFDQRAVLTTTSFHSVVFTSAYRFSTLLEFEPTDTPWTLAKACNWCLIECSSGIISACMPTLRPLFVMLSSKFASSIDTRTRTTGVQGSGLNRHDVGGSALRPPGEILSKQNVQLEVSQPDDASGDEVPLNTIRVQRDVTWQETSYDSSRRWN